MTYIVKIYFPHNNVNDIRKLIDEQCIDNDIEKGNILLCDDYDLDKVIKIIKKHKIEFKEPGRNSRLLVSEMKAGNSTMCI